MPKQVSPYKIGLFDGYIYYKTAKGYFMRKHVRPSAETLASSAYDKVRETNKKFKMATTLSRLLRNAFEPFAGQVVGADLHNRLQSAIQCALNEQQKADGELPVIGQEMVRSLKEVQWSDRHAVPSSLIDAATVRLDHRSGKFEVIINSVTPEWLRKRSKGATHCSVHAAYAIINLDKERMIAAGDETGLLEMKTGQSGDFMLTGKLPAKQKDSLHFVGLGISYYQVVNKEAYSLVEDSSFALLAV